MKTGTGDDNVFLTLDVSSEVAADVWEGAVKLRSFTLICLPGTGTRMVPSLRSSLQSCSIFIGMGEPAPWLERLSLVGPFVYELVTLTPSPWSDSCFLAGDGKDVRSFPTVGAAGLRPSKGLFLRRVGPVGPGYWAATGSLEPARKCWEKILMCLRLQ